MNPTNIYMLPGKIGLKFNGPAERDQFWNALSDAARAAAERIANRTIRLYPDRMKDPAGLIIPISGNGAGPVAVTQPKPAPPAPKPELHPGNVNVAAGGDPFALTGNVVKALPGMVAVQSNMPPEMPQERLGGVMPPVESQNLSQSQPSAVAAVLEPPEPKPETAKDDPEPKDRRTKAWRMWKLKQIEREKS